MLDKVAVDTALRLATSLGAAVYLLLYFRRRSARHRSERGGH